jgi:diguanylate cyclase (GGDEF)-like protein
LSSRIPEAGESADGPAGPGQPVSGSADARDTSGGGSAGDAGRAAGAGGENGNESRDDKGHAGVTFAAACGDGAKHGHGDGAEGRTNKRGDGASRPAGPDGSMDERSPEDLEAINDLKKAWVGRCQATGCDVGPEDDEERFGLLLALEAAATTDAVTRIRDSFSSRARPLAVPRPASTIGARRKALDSAAARWGARLASPALAVEQLLLLRHLTTMESGGERLGRLVDRALLVATRTATDELQVAAFTDPLTGCANRRAFERDIERELARCARAELDLCVIAVDIDGLKAVNDSHGHAAGDRVLLQVVETFRRALRSLDSVYRLGGDEFVLLLPDTSTDDAVTVMSRVEQFRPPSFSWGVASYTLSGTNDVGVLLAEADDALYDAKRSRKSTAHHSGPRPPASPDVPDSERRPISWIGAPEHDD